MILSEALLYTLGAVKTQSRQALESSGVVDRRSKVSTAADALPAVDARSLSLSEMDDLGGSGSAEATVVFAVEVAIAGKDIGNRDGL